VSRHLTPLGLDGLKRVEEKLERIAKDLARLPFSAGSANVAAADEVNLSDSMAAVLEARHSYEANLKLIATEDKLTEHTVDILG
jgi:hypothetical protein